MVGECVRFWVFVWREGSCIWNLKEIIEEDGDSRKGVIEEEGDGNVYVWKCWFFFSF